MPAPEKKLFAYLAKASFIGKKISLPVQWSDPGPQYEDAFFPDEIKVSPNPPMTLFQAESLNVYHVKTAREMGEKFENYIDGITHAVSDAIDQWMKMTMIAAVTINGPVGTLLPGAVAGPPLFPLIMALAPKRTPQETKYSIAIARAFSTNWQQWHMGLIGILSYPLFAAFPGPMAPPAPNIPVPLISFSSAGESGLSPRSLKNMMVLNLGDPNALHSEALFDAISKAFGTLFQIFKTSTSVQKVMGTGPIPSFAPPAVPAGPVVGGSVIPAPGVLM